MRANIESLRKMYPSGTRVRLTETMDDPQPIEAGTCGTVIGVDDAGQLLMKWDNGRSLALLPGVDGFVKIA